jgi:hypothetical protein
MASLVKELPISEMMATFELLTRFGVCRDDLAKFRGADIHEQRRRVAGFLGSDTLRLTRPGTVFDVPAVNDFDTRAFTWFLCDTTPIFLPDSFKRNLLPETGYSQKKGKVHLVEVTAEKWSHYDLIIEVAGEDGTAVVPLYFVYKALEYKERARDHAPLAAFVKDMHGKLVFLTARRTPDGWAISLAEPEHREWSWPGGMQLVARV